MAKESLVNVIKTFLLELREKEGTTIDRAALIPAYEGMVSGLFILTVSMPGKTAFFKKTEYVIHALFNYVPQEQRQSIAGVRVFDSAEEFDHYLRFDYRADVGEIRPEELRIYSPHLRPELIPVEA